MYRDEQEALKARRDSLKQEIAEVDERLKATKAELKRSKTIGIWLLLQPIFGGLITIYFTCLCCALTSILMFNTLPDPELAPDPDASASPEHGVIPPRPEPDPNGEFCEFDPDCRSGYVCVQGRCSFSIPEYCAGADDNCDTGVNESSDIVFLFDTSPSMEAHLGYLKEAVMSYASETNAIYTLAETLPESGYGRMTEYRDKGKFISAVSQIGVNPRVVNEYIPLLLDEWTVSRINRLVFAFTDEEPMVPTDRYYDYVVNPRRGLYGLCARNRNATFTVFTTPQNVAAWRELGSCIRVYGEL